MVKLCISSVTMGVLQSIKQNYTCDTLVVQADVTLVVVEPEEAPAHDTTTTSPGIFPISVQTSDKMLLDSSWSTPSTLQVRLPEPDPDQEQFNLENCKLPSKIF